MSRTWTKGTFSKQCCQITCNLVLFGLEHSMKFVVVDNEIYDNVFLHWKSHLIRMIQKQKPYYLFPEIYHIVLLSCSNFCRKSNCNSSWEYKCFPTYAKEQKKNKIDQSVNSSFCTSKIKNKSNFSILLLVMGTGMGFL